uniref:Uncharacterized protein n=1 Tax=Anguilla anguilla TaxID=7936 RepID=A0A0E9TJN7_ANGAN
MRCFIVLIYCQVCAKIWKFLQLHSSKLILNIGLRLFYHSCFG